MLDTDRKFNQRLVIVVLAGWVSRRNKIYAYMYRRYIVIKSRTMKSNHGCRRKQ